MINNSHDSSILQMFCLLLASSACAQQTVRERLQSTLQDQRFSQPQQVSQPAVAPSRLTQQPFLGQDSLIKPLPVVQQSFAQQTQGVLQAQQPARQAQQTVRQQQLGRLRLEEIRREQELRRQQEIQRRQAAQRQLEVRRRQLELRQQEENRRREAARRQLERERQRQEATVREQERQREQEELRQRQQNLLQQAAERRRLQPNIPTLDDVRDGPFQDGTYYFGLVCLFHRSSDIDIHTFIILCLPVHLLVHVSTRIPKHNIIHQLPRKFNARNDP